MGLSPGIRLAPPMPRLTGHWPWRRRVCRLGRSRMRLHFSDGRARQQSNRGGRSDESVGLHFPLHRGARPKRKTSRPRSPRRRWLEGSGPSGPGEAERRDGLRSSTQNRKAGRGGVRPSLAGVVISVGVRRRAAAPSLISESIPPMVYEDRPTSPASRSRRRRAMWPVIISVIALVGAIGGILLATR